MLSVLQASRAQGLGFRVWGVGLLHQGMPCFSGAGMRCPPRARGRASLADLGRDIVSSSLRSGADTRARRDYC